MQPVVIIVSGLGKGRRLLFRFLGKHLGPIVHGLHFSWVNDSSIRCLYSHSPQEKETHLELQSPRARRHMTN